jgi:hypothetical protein
MRLGDNQRNKTATYSTRSVWLASDEPSRPQILTPSLKKVVLDCCFKTKILYLVLSLHKLYRQLKLYGQLVFCLVTATTGDRLLDSLLSGCLLSLFRVGSAVGYC